MFTNSYLILSHNVPKQGPVWNLKTCNVIKKRLQATCFPVNFAKFLRTPFSKNISWWLLLMTVLSHGQSIKSLRAVGLCGGTFSLKSALLGRGWLELCPLYFIIGYFFIKIFQRLSKLCLSQLKPLLQFCTPWFSGVFRGCRNKILT